MVFLLSGLHKCKFFTCPLLHFSELISYNLKGNFAKIHLPSITSCPRPSGNGKSQALYSVIQLNLCKVTTEYWCLSRQVVFHNRENKHDFVKTVPGKSSNLCVFYRKTSIISHTLVCNKIVDHSDVVGALPVGAAPTTSSYLTLHLALMDWVKTTGRLHETQLSFEILCDLYGGFYFIQLPLLVSQTADWLPGRFVIIRFHKALKLQDCINSLRPRQNGRLFADDVIKCIFLNENVRILIKNSLKFVPKGPINNIPALVQIMAWRCPGDKPLSEPMMVSLPTHICVTRPQWVKALEYFSYQTLSLNAFHSVFIWHFV